ncbi:MAG: Rrf2 family transcriptional regulator [Roseibium sp.]|uniref:RrF2 family transcriptional regulator n=1 Tax=Roseibium sp. TaxID=1936156 RepID=UPI002610F538|nr:Rrf2 family transcriptional regulator [Roseibium sp.]MCV0427152.1 Rrf2 family transcriptional regulator [Roseibium sp.]
MRTDSRLPRVLHVLLHLAQHEAPLTSDQIGAMLGTNPSLVRRMMAGLRKAGFVSSTKGHGGGWYLSRQLDEISLADVYKALGSPPLFAVGPSGDTSACLLERAANEITRQALDAANTVFQQKLASTTVAEITNPYSDIIKSFHSDN